VGQKTVGYTNASGNPFTPDLLKAFDFVDASLGKVVAKLKAKNLFEETLIIIASKHGQTPIDPTKYGKIDPEAVTNATNVPLLWATVRIAYILSLWLASPGANARFYRRTILLSFSSSLRVTCKKR